MRCAAAGTLCNLSLACPANQASIVAAGAIPAFAELLYEAQPDGQYSAAAALFNLAADSTPLLQAYKDAEVVEVLVPLLHQRSWYCRIVAADVLARLATELDIAANIVEQDCLLHLVSLLRLPHKPGMLELTDEYVSHLSYERGEEVVVMKGYKFAKAKLAAAASLGCLAAVLDPERDAEVLKQGKVVAELTAMLQSGLPAARQLAACALGDLAFFMPEVAAEITAGGVLTTLLALVSKWETGRKSNPSSQSAQALIAVEDAGAAAGAIAGLLGPLSRPQLVDAAVRQGCLGPLIALLRHGSPMARFKAAAALKSLAREPEAAQEKSLAKTAQAAVAGREVSSLMSAALTPETIPAGDGRATATMIRSAMAKSSTGFAITPKPSANLYILLQIPFEALLPAEVRRMVAPDSHIPAAELAPEAYQGRPDDIQGLQLEDRSPSLALSEEPAPPLGERRKKAAKRAQSSGASVMSSPGRALPGNEPPPQDPLTSSPTMPSHRRTLPGNLPPPPDTSSPPRTVSSASKATPLPPPLSPSAQDALALLQQRPTFPPRMKSLQRDLPAEESRPLGIGVPPETRLGPQQETPEPIPPSLRGDGEANGDQAMRQSSRRSTSQRASSSAGQAHVPHADLGDEAALPVGTASIYDDLAQYLCSSRPPPDSALQEALQQNAEASGGILDSPHLPQIEIRDPEETPQSQGWIRMRAGRIEASEDGRMVNDITADVGLPHQQSSESTTYQHGNPLFVTHESGSFEEEALAAQTQAPAEQQPVSGIQPAAAVTGVADLYRSHNPQHIASTDPPRFNAPHSSPQAAIRPAATFQDQSPAYETLPSHPVSQPALTSQAIPRSSSPRGVADLYRRGGSSFGPAGGPSSSSSKRSRSRPSQPTALSDSQSHSGSRSRSRDRNHRQALGISSSEIAGSRAGSSFRSESIAEAPGGRSDGTFQPDGGYRRSSGTRRSGSREGRDRSDMGPSEPRLASISVNRRSAEGRLKPQQELSPRSHARQVSQALAHLQAEHKQRFAVPGSAADQPTADAASEGEAPSIGLQRPAPAMPRASGVGRLSDSSGTSAYLNHKARFMQSRKPSGKGPLNPILSSFAEEDSDSDEDHKAIQGLMGRTPAATATAARVLRQYLVDKAHTDACGRKR
ncbi:hypothetical protein WJX84_003998 [Apatococcus fuscideae]|uniref:Uncharacterized protein n=1 Tax=Apatococcus fuscideae TaxID=2026836 RepID=A0AAW1SLD6_9CHLO